MYFDRDDVALLGFYKYFKELSDEKRCDAEKLMKYQNQRGGRIVLQNIQVWLYNYIHVHVLELQLNCFLTEQVSHLSKARRYVYSRYLNQRHSGSFR
jgi:ferritin